MMKQFDNASYQFDDSVLDAPVSSTSSDVMTLSGTLNKSILLMMILVGSALTAAFLFPSSMVMYGGMIGAFIVALIVSFKPTMAPTLAPVYAVLKGAFLGLVSLQFAVAIAPGIIFKAVGLTITTLIVMLLIYRSGLIPVTKKFRMAVVSATIGIMFMYIVAFVMSMFFGVDPIYLHDGGWISIGLSLFIIGVAALNFLLDFDMIERGVQSRAPKYMEWYGGFALLVTLAWLYFEFLRLLAMLASSD